MGIGAAGIGQSSQTGGATVSGPSGTPPGGQLGENAFLQLLVAQLKYQDPMQPVDNTQFVTQLAQFQMLSVLSDIKTDMDHLVAAGGSSTPQGTGTGGTGTPSTGTAGSGGGTAAPTSGGGG